MNKIDAGSISVYTRKMVGLAATFKICARALFVLLCCFMTDIKLKQVQYIHLYIFQENTRPVRTFPFGICSLLFSLAFFLSFILSRVSFFLSLCLPKTHRIASFPTTRNTKAKISQCRPLRYFEKKKEKVSSSFDHIK